MAGPFSHRMKTVNILHPSTSLHCDACAISIVEVCASVVRCAGGVCCQRRRGEWWIRLSLDTEHLGRPEEALEARAQGLGFRVYP